MAWGNASVVSTNKGSTLPATRTARMSARVSAATIGALTLFLADEPALPVTRRAPADVAGLVKTFGLEPRLTAMGLWPLQVLPSPQSLR